MSDRGNSLAMVRAVAAIGFSLGMATTTEGVETREQFERVKKEGCTEVQGYLYSRPNVSAKLPLLLAENQRRIAVPAKVEPAPLG